MTPRGRRSLVDTFIHNTGLRCESVGQAEVSDGARPCPLPRTAGESPDGVETRSPDAATGGESNVSSCKAGVL